MEPDQQPTDTTTSETTVNFSPQTEELNFPPQTGQYVVTLHGLPDTDIIMDRRRNLRPRQSTGTDDMPSRHPPMHDKGFTRCFMSSQVYEAITTGNVAFFQSNLEELGPPSPERLSPRGDSVLHIAAQSGRDEIVRLILTHCVQHLEHVNLVGNTVLQVAASAGHLTTAKILVSAMWQIDRHLMSSSASTSNNAGSNNEVSFTRSLLMHRNRELNTALHMALRNGHVDVASFLFETEPAVTHNLNCQGKSPLHLAVEAGNVELFELMMKVLVEIEDHFQDHAERRVAFYKFNVVLAAIRAKNKGILNLMLRDWEGFLYIFFFEEMHPHPISYAAEVGYLEGVREMLNKWKYCSYTANKKGFFPIHIAASNGHTEIIQEFLKHCPDSRELLNNESQNILHLAAMSGKAKAVSYMLKNLKLQMLINERDCNGNTPLHLATKGGHAKVVNILTWESRVELGLMNGEGKTATNVAESYSGKVPSFRERLTWIALRHAGAPRAPNHSSTSIQNSRPSREETITNNAEFYKDRINILILVSTLIVTITFAAGLTSPGGGNDSDSNEDNTTWFQKFMLHVFVISNTVAMYTSITVVIALIWAQLGDRDLVLASVRYTVAVLGISLAAVAIAFMAGVYTIVSNNTGLAIFVSVLGFVGFLTQFALFAPLCTPTSLKHRTARYIFYYPFCLLIKLTQNDD